MPLRSVPDQLDAMSSRGDRESSRGAPEFAFVADLKASFAEAGKRCLKVGRDDREMALRRHGWSLGADQVNLSPLTLEPHGGP